jgi:hypothetical protein
MGISEDETVEIKQSVSESALAEIVATDEPLAGDPATEETVDDAAEDAGAEADGAAPVRSDLFRLARFLRSGRT